MRSHHLYDIICLQDTSLSRLYEKPEDGQNRPKHVVFIHCTYSTINQFCFDCQLYNIPIKHKHYTFLMQQLWFIIISSLYMFRTSICPSSGVFYIQVVLCTVHKTTHRLRRTTATTPSAEHNMQQYTTCTSEDGHIDVRNMQRLLMIIYHNCCIKLVRVVIFIYDARSHIRGLEL